MQLFPRTKNAVAHLMMSLLLLVCSSVGATQATPDEDTLKALFVIKMCLFVQWDLDSAGSSDQQHFVLGVLGDENMVEVFQSLLAETSIQSLPVHVIAVSSYKQAAACNLLYIDHPIDSYVERFIQQIDEDRTLVIDAYSERVRLGSHFGLKLVEHRIRFDANYRAIQSSQLTIDFRLVQLADKVIGN